MCGVRCIGCGVFESFSGGQLGLGIVIMITGPIAFNLILMIVCALVYGSCLDCTPPISLHTYNNCMSVYFVIALVSFPVWLSKVLRSRRSFTSSEGFGF